MIIGFDGSRAFAGERTGTENYSYQLLKELAKIDRVNKYIVYLRPAAKQGDDWPENFQFKIINWSRLWTQGGLAIQTLKDRLDVLFVPAHTLPVIKQPGLKTVVTVHDLGSEYLPSMHQVKQRVYLGFMQKYQLQTATKIIAVSKATKKDLVKRLGIAPEKIRVVYEGYNRSLFEPIQSDTLVNSLSQYGLKPGEYFLFVGTVQPRKNLERLIRAYAKMAGSFDKHFGRQPHSLARQRKRPAVASGDLGYALRLSADRLGLAVFGGSLPSLVIAGSKGWMSDEIYQLPKKLGIEDRVKFLGYVPEKNLPALYSGAVALTFPSLFEGFGLPILEAQASGCPVLASGVSSMPEVAGPPAGGGAIFVDPYSVDDIVKGMVEIANEDTKRRVIKAGFENIKRFSWEKCARETLKVLLSS